MRDFIFTAWTPLPFSTEKCSINYNFSIFSPEMRKLQKQLLCGNKTDFIPDEKTISKVKLGFSLILVTTLCNSMQKTYLYSVITRWLNLFQFGTEVHWHDSLRSVPKQFSFFIAHEFFDALPIHKFVKTKVKYREITKSMYSNWHEYSILTEKCIENR